jgi:hypothetical protein
MTFHAQRPFASLVLVLLPLRKAKLGKRTVVTVSLRHMDMELSSDIVNIKKVPFFYLFL